MTVADTPTSADAPDDRSLAMLRRSGDALFVLNRVRRFRFVNAAFERLTGLAAAEVLGQGCTLRKGASPLARALHPPAEARAGRPARARRPVPPARTGPPWWEVSFLPLRDADGVYALLGRVDLIPGIPPPTNAGTRVLTVPLTALREPVADRYTFDLLVGESAEAGRLVSRARLAASTSAPLLLVGPAGAGKQTFARVAHHEGTTRGRNFVRIDAAGLPPSVLGLVLFGLNGLASPERLGTLYLREPARLPRDVQARLAEWLAERPADGPRLAAGTRTDPREDLAAGRLAPELFHTLAVLTVEVPPLRDRRADLSRLTANLLERARAAGLPAAPGLTTAARDCLTEYDWPGNVRELDGVLAEASAMAGDAAIDLPHLPVEVRRAVGLARTPASARPKIDLRGVLAETERRLIDLAMRHAGGKQEEAAELLSVPRAYLWRWFKGRGAE